MRGPQPGFFDRMVSRVMSVGDPEAARGRKLTVSRELGSDERLLQQGELWVVRIDGPCAVSCSEGSAWVTRPGRFCDYVLEKGESLSLQGEGKVIVSGGGGGAVVRVVTE